MIDVKAYNEECRAEWNSFTEKARTQTVLFSRNFMDYHKDRFQDFSLMVYEDNALVAVFPASVKNGIVNSHGGLTFGGFLTARNEYAKNTIRYITAVFKFFHAAGIEKIIYKQSPSFYNIVSQDETDYAMFLADATLFRMDIAFAVNQRLQEKIPYQERRNRAIKKAVKNGVVITETYDFAPFWNIILCPNLQERFNVKPVHSLEEIRLLSDLNPGMIRQFEARQNDVLLAGCTVFESQTVAHAQYISASNEGRQNGAIDLLFHELITVHFTNKEVFDFGIANEKQGKVLNNYISVCRYRFYHLKIFMLR